MEIWTKLPAWLRLTISLGLVAIGAAIFFLSERVPVGIVGTLVGLGFILLLIGPSDADKNGYRF